MAQSSSHILVQVVGHEDTDAVELDQLARQLRRWLLANDADVRLAQAGDGPPDTRATDIMTIGALVVTVITSRPILTSILSTVQAYLELSKARSVKIQIDGDSLEITGLRLDDQRRLIESFVDRHANVDE
jgi:hypothetical protein